MSFVKFAGIPWPERAFDLLRVSVRDVVAWRDHLVEKEAAPKTLHRRIASLSSFHKYLAAAELRLPITVPVHLGGDDELLPVGRDVVMSGVPQVPMVIGHQHHTL